jgi:hypothetical protein
MPICSTRNRIKTAETEIIASPIPASALFCSRGKVAYEHKLIIKLHFSNCRSIKSRMIQWAGHVARMGEKRNAYRILVGKPEGKRPLGRPRRRWEDNIVACMRRLYKTGIGLTTGFIGSHSYSVYALTAHYSSL